MTKVINATFTPTYDNSYEAADAVAHYVQPPALLRAASLHFWALYGLATFGLAALFVQLRIEDAGVAFVYAFCAAAVLGYLLMYIAQVIEKRMHDRYVAAIGIETQHVSMDSTGFTLTMGGGSYQIPWVHVIEIFKTANTIGIIAPLTPIYVPCTALSDPDAVFHAMRDWHKEARQT